jgi:hypothetical protein
MNSIVSAASLATATAVAVPSMANPAPTADATSFPDLVARFMRVRERWRTQRALNQAWSDKIDGLLFKATGISRAEWPDNPRHPRWTEFQATHGRIIDENPSGDPTDEHGCSIAWTEIDNQLRPLAKAMLNQTPRSTTDLAWQAEALLTADCELAEGDDIPDGSLVRKLIKNVFALSGTLPIPGLPAEAPTPEQPDPAKTEYVQESGMPFEPPLKGEGKKPQ